MLRISHYVYILSCSCNITDESDLTLSSGQFLTFGPDLSSHFIISIDIVDDVFFESESENFVVGLSPTTTELRGLRLGIANLTIKDNDSKLCIYYS